MDTATHLETLRAEGAAFASAAEQAGLDAPVPSCPDWRVRDLVTHLTGVHRWTRTVIESGISSRPSSEARSPLFVPAPDAEAIDAYRTAHAELIRALDDAEPDALAWTFFEAPSPVAFWTRRQAHETAIHRLDAELAAGCGAFAVTGSFSPGFAADFAADGIDELLVGFLGRAHGKLVGEPPMTVAFAPDDDPASWTMYVTSDTPRTVPGVDPAADMVLRGPAGRLYALLWNRADTAGCRVEGRSELLDVWRQSAGI